MKKYFFLVLLLFVASSGVCISNQPKNVILMISDGTGFNAFEAASYYQYGQLGQQVYDSFPVKIACTTYMLNANGKPQGYDSSQMWTNFNYPRINPTDSAAAATAINSGVKSYSGAVNFDFNRKSVRTIAQILESMGKSSGVVTSVFFSHATPACVSAHNDWRDNYPQIANEMIYGSGLDVIMGCGEGITDNFYVGGNNTWADITDANGANRFAYIADENDFAMIADSNYAAGWPDKVLGICHAGSSLSENPANVPTLATMSVGALNVLSKNENGFYVMIEGGEADWENHNRNISGMIREMVVFNEAVEAVVGWVENNGGWDKNLLMITCDHECGMIWGPNSYSDVDGNGAYWPGADVFNGWNHVANNGQGNIPGVQYGYTSHTNALVPFYAKGAGSEIFAGLIKGNDSNAGAFWNFSGDY
ncbi:MAG TPA: alkaline phosphatase, partial [Sedimentisphaerales bacterium]|nr:alkaline phosphatase [Sedimentisphaerales bacterium]